MVQNIDQSNVLGRVRGSRDEEQRERMARVRVRYVQSNPQSNFTAPIDIPVKYSVKFPTANFHRANIYYHLTTQPLLSAIYTLIYTPSYIHPTIYYHLGNGQRSKDLIVMPIEILTVWWIE